MLTKPILSIKYPSSDASFIRRMEKDNEEKLKSSYQPTQTPNTSLVALICLSYCGIFDHGGIVKPAETAVAREWLCK
jgi:hypothetical protein